MKSIRITDEMNDALEKISKTMRIDSINKTAVIGLENLINQGVEAFIPHAVKQGAKS